MFEELPARAREAALVLEVDARLQREAEGGGQRGRAHLAHEPPDALELGGGRRLAVRLLELGGALPEAEPHARHVGGAEELHVQPVLRRLGGHRDGHPRHARPSAAAERRAHDELHPEVLLQPELDGVDEPRPAVLLAEALRRRGHVPAVRMHSGGAIR